MIDLAGGGYHTAINAADFVFKLGNDHSPSTWATVTATPTISVRGGARVRLAGGHLMASLGANIIHGPPSRSDKTEGDEWPNGPR